MRVVILGCGPAGLLAAHAVKMAAGKDADIWIYSIKKKSPMAGAQYVHVPIPGIRVKGSTVTFHKFGTKEGYAKKVYGDPNHECSWDNFPDGNHECWSMKKVYENLWRRWEDRIIDAPISNDLLDDLEDSPAELLISSVPAPVLCDNGQHIFEATTVKIDSHRVDAKLGNVIIYDGMDDPTHPYYRTSSLFGWFAMEYGPGATPPADYVNVHKPQSHNCDCRQQWRRVGRYGKWQRGVLVHHGYEEVHHAMLSL